jgi:hypothetical protein
MKIGDSLGIERGDLLDAVLVPSSGQLQEVYQNRLTSATLVAPCYC